jgi:hypothetical protein
MDVGLEITFRSRCACYTCKYAYSAIPRDKENSFEILKKLLRIESHHHDNGNVSNRTSMDTGLFNSFQAIVPLTGQEKGVLLLRECTSLKNRSYRPLLRASTSPFKSTCLLTRLKEVLGALYRPHLRC